MDVLEILDRWVERHAANLEARGVSVSVTRGPKERIPSSAWLDFESSERSARLMLWSNGDADLTIGDLPLRQVLLEEHREITTELGLNNAEATVISWLA